MTPTAPVSQPPADDGRRGWRRRVRLGVLWLAGLFIIWLFLLWPPPLWYRWEMPRETAFMAMRRHEDPARADHRDYRPVPLSAIAPTMRRAALIGEDIRFYQHQGVDYVEVRHALGYRPDDFSWSNPRQRTELLRSIAHSAMHPSDIRGASTITQQLARNLYLTPNRNPFRKIKELITAWRLEVWLPKNRILELYLNTAETGDAIWGVEAAAQRYFGVSAAQLTPAQAASIAGLLPFPRSSNPAYHPDRMNWRRDLILRRMR